MWKFVFASLAAVLAVGLGAMPGAFTDIDVDDAGARDALNFAVAKHNEDANELCPSQPVEVMRVQRQVVAGSKYVITVRMRKTPCRKVCASDNACAVNAATQIYQCDFTVWSRPWLQEITLLDETCS